MKVSKRGFIKALLAAPVLAIGYKPEVEELKTVDSYYQYRWAKVEDANKLMLEGWRLAGHKMPTDNGVVYRLAKRSQKQ